MATPKQAAANRRNAALPRGPLSPEASAAVRQNAIKHGLTAKHIALKHEDYAACQELQASIVMEYQPATPQEHRYCDQIAQNYWRLLRCRRVETATFENRLAALKNRLEVDPKDQAADDQGISICMANHARDFDLLRRYETSIERAWRQAIRELRIAQGERRAAEAADLHEQSQAKANKPQVEDTCPQRSFSVSVAAAPNRANETTRPEIGIGCVSQGAPLTPGDPPNQP